jgi:HEAT repeats
LSLALLLKNHFKREQDPDTLNTFIEYFLFSIRRNLEIRNFTSCNDLFSTLDTRPDSTDKIEAQFSVEIDSLWPILERDLRDSTDGTQTALTFVKRCGSAGVNYLLDWLSEEQEQRVRSRILNYVETMNHSQVAPELQKRLTDDRWYVVRNMVTLLTRIKADQKLSYIHRALQNHDPRIAKEALKFLMGEASRDHIPLLQALLQHPDKNIRAQALRAVPRFGADNVRSTLHAMASNDPVSELRTLAGSLLNKS